MAGALAPVLAAMLGLLAGAGIAAALLRRRHHAHRATQGKTLRVLSHDLRGALSPGVLMAERLESHADPQVRQSAQIISLALDRAASLTKSLSALGRGEAPP